MLRELRFQSSALFFASLVAIIITQPGCSFLVPRIPVKNWDKGYTIILPGIESRHLLHREMAMGLHNGGVHGTIEIHDWTTGLPPLMLMHLRYMSRNQRQAALVAQKIIDYQDQYPGRPVNLIGHSGGGGLALLTLESLPEGRQVDTTILLGAAISPRFDLRTALQHSRDGIWNYSSMLLDSPLLVAGTTLAGTVDGNHMPAAGAIGFFWPDNMSDFDRWLYKNRLHEKPYRLRFLLNGNLGGHYGPMTRSFAAHNLAPIILNAAKSANE
jgi:pimeloyl-ACP methyl ester carboxylesterase